MDVQKQRGPSFAGEPWLLTSGPAGVQDITPGEVVGDVLTVAKQRGRGGAREDAIPVCGGDRTFHPLRACLSQQLCSGPHIQSLSRCTSERLCPAAIPVCTGD